MVFLFSFLVGCPKINSSRPFLLKTQQQQQSEFGSVTIADSTAQYESSETQPNADEPEPYGYVDGCNSKAAYDANQQPLVSSMAKHKAGAIKIQIQASQSNLNGPTNYRRHISFDETCKKEDGDEVRTNPTQRKRCDLYRTLCVCFCSFSVVFPFVLC